MIYYMMMHRLMVMRTGYCGLLEEERANSPKGNNSCLSIVVVHIQASQMSNLNFIHGASVIPVSP
jgi:hypothetical protein